MDPIDRYAELLEAEDRAVVEIRMAVGEGRSITAGIGKLKAACNARLEFEAAQGWDDDAAIDAACAAGDRVDGL